MSPIWAFGSEEQKNRSLPPMARGELIGCFGLTEPHGGSDPANMKTHAKKRGGDWVLNGSKMWITDRKSTRLNSSHSQISYAVFCLKKKKKNEQHLSADR